MKNKGIILVAIILLIITAFLSLPISSSQNKGQVLETEKITLKVITNRTDVVDNKLKELSQKYTGLNPNINVVIEGLKDPNELLKIKASSGMSGDITIIPTDANMENYNLYYVPIDDLGFTKENLNGYFTGVGKDNRLYAVNSSINYDGIVYNKEAFKKAGITQIPRAIEEFYNACEKLKKVGITPFAINYSEKWTLKWYGDEFVLPIIMTGNNNYSSEIIDKELFTNDNGVLAAFTFLKNMRDKGYLEENFTDTNWNSFKINQANGEIAMSFLGTWYPSQLIDLGAKKENIGMFPFPESKVILQSGDWRFAISKNSKNIEEAKKLFKWLFFDGNYAEACNVIPPIENKHWDYWFIDELLSYDLPIIQSFTVPLKTQNIFSNMGTSLNTIIQEYLDSDNEEAVIEKYNKLWEKGKE